MRRLSGWNSTLCVGARARVCQGGGGGVAADATTGSGAGTQRQQQPTRHRALPVCWQLPAQEAGSCRRNRRRPHHFVGDRQLAAIRLLRRLDELHLLRRQHHLARLAKLLQRWKDGCRASVCVCVWGGGGTAGRRGTLVCGARRVAVAAPATSAPLDSDRMPRSVSVALNFILLLRAACCCC
jgi:hypothetical protein